MALTRPLTASRAGIGSAVVTDSQSGKTQILVGVGASSEAQAASVVAADLNETASAQDVADTQVGGHIISADIYEPVSSVVTADSTSYTADNTTWPTADGGVLAGATDYADAEVVPAEEAIGGGGAYVPKLRVFYVEGDGYGVLPALEGEGHGFVVVVGAAAGALPRITGEAAGGVGAAGDSFARLAAVRANGRGDHGKAGAAHAAFSMAAAARGSAVVCGAGRGVITTPVVVATGRHDDEEAAIMALLLAA